MYSRRCVLRGAIAASGAAAFAVIPAAAAVEVGFDDLYERETVLTERLRSLAGETVEMVGYMAPPLKAEAAFFVLTRTPMAVCPFCETEMQWPDDIVLVLTEDVIGAVPFNVRIRVTGRLDLGFEKDADTGFVSLIRLEIGRVPQGVGRMLSAEGLRLSFRDADGLPFSVLDLPQFAPPPGGVTVVRGPSGSGKSTLLHVLAGLQPPDSGTVRFEGLDIYRMSEARRDAWRRDRVGFVFQDFHLLPELSPLGNVTVAGTFARSRRDVRGRGRELLERLGVPLGRRSIEQLSRGERQRVAIARALLFDPPVILADEPTASLDAAAGEAVLDALRDLARAGKTVVLVSHEPKAFADADMLVTLERGHAVEARRAAA